MRPCGFCANHHHRYCPGGGLCSCALVGHKVERFNGDDRAYVAGYTDPTQPVAEVWPRWLETEKARQQ